MFLMSDNLSIHIKMIHEVNCMAREKKIDMVILGLLCHEDLTGYDIKKRMDGAISFFWKGSFGNIYPTLRDLVDQGLIVKDESTEGGREKITYHITKQGRAALRSWLKESQVSNELRYETLLKLFFGGETDKEVTIRNIDVFEKQVREDLALLKGYESVLKEDLKKEDHLYYYLTVTFGIESYEAYLKWCNKARKLLS